MLTMPSWLQKALGLLNFTIFTWNLFIGDALTPAFEWVIGQVNSVVTVAYQAYNLARTAVESNGMIYSYIAGWQESFGNAVKGWIASMAYGILDQLNTVAGRVRSLEEYRDELIVKVLPDFVTRVLLEDTLDAELAPLKELIEKNRLGVGMFLATLNYPETFLMYGVERLIVRFW